MYRPGNEAVVLCAQSVTCLTLLYNNNNSGPCSKEHLVKLCHSCIDVCNKELGHLPLIESLAFIPPPRLSTTERFSSVMTDFKRSGPECKLMTTRLTSWALCNQIPVCLTLITKVSSWIWECPFVVPHLSNVYSALKCTPCRVYDMAYVYSIRVRPNNSNWHWSPWQPNNGSGVTLSASSVRNQNNITALAVLYNGPACK